MQVTRMLLLTLGILVSRNYYVIGIERVKARASSLSQLVIIQTGIHAGRHAGRQTCRQAGMQVDVQADMQADR